MKNEVETGVRQALGEDGVRGGINEYSQRKKQVLVSGEEFK